MDIEIFDFEKEIKKLESPRHPHDIVNIGDSVLRAVLCQGEGKWYVHDYDEFFMYYKGDVIIESDNSSIKLEPNAGVLVPAGVRHRTNSKEAALFLVFRHKLTSCMLA